MAISGQGGNPSSPRVIPAPDLGSINISLPPLRQFSSHFFPFGIPAPFPVSFQPPSLTCHPRPFSRVIPAPERGSKEV